MNLIAATLDGLYRKYNRKKYVSPDPLQFLYDYPDVRDREIVALIASSLAYGRVAQILKSVENVLKKMGPSPYTFLGRASTRSLSKVFCGFKHRFTTATELVSLMRGMRKLVSEYGSLNECFLTGLKKSHETILPALRNFVSKLDFDGNHLIPSPERGSACKRLNLFLRWMVRKDAVDLGGWCGISKSKLIVPLDTHMAKVGRALGLTQRKSADMKMALDITLSFRKLCTRDPVKYDFVLTRFGIRDDFDLKALLHQQKFESYLVNQI